MISIGKLCEWRVKLIESKKTLGDKNFMVFYESG
jgi:hypothetical protein